MAVFSGNPADRAMGGVPGSLREASGVGGLSNGTTRNNNFGGQTSRAEAGGGGGNALANSTGDRGFSATGGRVSTLSRDLGDRGLRANTSGVGAGSMKDQARIGFDTVNTSAKGNYLGAPTDRKSMVGVSKMSTGPVSRGITGVVKTASTAPTVSSTSSRMTGIQDYKSIVPGKVTMTAEKVPFGQKNPSLAKYMGGTPAKPVNVSVEEAKKMAGTVAKTGAYVSSANWAAQMGLPKSTLSKVGTTTSGYGTTTIKAGAATVGLSYPKSVATGKSLGAYTAGSLSSTGPVSRGVQPKSSTGPVSRNFSAGPSMSTGPVSRGAQPKSSTGPVSRGTQPATVSQVRATSRLDKASAVKPSTMSQSRPERQGEDRVKPVNRKRIPIRRKEK